MRRLLLAMATLGLAGVAGPGGVCRAALLDQSYLGVGHAYVVGEVTSPSPAQVEQGQTFTVGTAGLLTGLNVQVGNFDTTPGTTTADLVVSVRLTSGGMPGPSMAVVHVPASSVPTGGFLGQPAWVNVDLSAYYLPVSAGQLLAVVVDSTAIVGPSQGYFWFAGSNAADYPAGSAWGHTVGYSWNQDSFDFGFQDFVTPVPEPSLAALAFLGLLGLVATQRHSPPGWTSRRVG